MPGDISAIILAGGKSSRMGVNKALLRLGGRSIVEIIIDKLADIFEEIIVTTKSKDLYSPLKVKVVEDMSADYNSLLGIHTGLLNSDNFYNFVIACDMPFLNPPLIRYMIKQRIGYEVIIPKIDEHLEPLHAIYSKECLKPIEGLLSNGDLKIINFFPQVRVRYISRDEIICFDPEFKSFFNLNTSEEYEKAKLLSWE